MFGKLGDLIEGPVISTLRGKLMKGEIHPNSRLDETVVRGDFDGDGTLDWGDVQVGIGHIIDNVGNAAEKAGDVIAAGWDIITNIF